MDVKGFVTRVRTAVREGGVAQGARAVADERLEHHAIYYGYRAFRSGKGFTLGGERYGYFYHKYNHTWRNERSVEVPIARRAVARAAGARILEVGNVLSHYGPTDHDVVDKYEIAPGVINEDVVDFTPEEKYDLIVTVSTLEHVGWDESPRDPQKILRAVRHLKTECLKPGGRLVATMPIGYHPEVATLASGKEFTRVHFLQRLNRLNDWREASWSDVKDAKVGAPFPAANAILVGIVE